MSDYTSEEKSIVKPGPPWKIVKRFASYEDADKFRNNHISENPDKQVKVRRYSECFVVKDRLDPALAPKKVKTGKNKKRGKKNG